MDTSGAIIDSGHLKLKIGEVIESSLNIIETGTKNIQKELSKIRDDYSGLINKCIYLLFNNKFWNIAKKKI
jgi:hypothetical protein